MRESAPHTHAGSFVPGPRIYMRLARCNPGKARGRQAGQATRQGQAGRQAPRQAGRAGRCSGAVAADICMFSDLGPARGRRGVSRPCAAEVKKKIYTGV